MRYYLAAYALLKHLISIAKIVYNIPSLKLTAYLSTFFLESLLTTGMYMRALLNGTFLYAYKNKDEYEEIY